MSDTIRIVTIQSAQAWQKAQARGVLRTDGRYSSRDFRCAYRWMAAQLADRVGRAPAGVTYPVWGWYRYRGRQYPNWQAYYRYAPEGESGVYVVADIPADKVLLSCFHKWHCVLNDQYLSADEADDDANENASRDVIEASWQGVFDLTPSEWWDVDGRQDIQTCLWELNLDWVVRVKEFKGTRK
jgi:hypothetical protein